MSYEKEQEKWDRALPPYCDEIKDDDPIIGHLEVSVTGDVDMLQKFEEFLDGISEKLDLDITY